MRRRPLLVLVAVVLCAALCGSSARPAAARPLEQRELLTNNSFEDPGVWEQDTSQKSNISTAAPRTGARSADFCGTNRCYTGLSQQSFRGVGQIESATLTFSYRFDTNEPGNTCNDGMFIALGPVFSGNPDQLGALLCTGDRTNGAYRTLRYDVTDDLRLCGRDGGCRLTISAGTDEARPSRMFVDDISISYVPVIKPTPPNQVTAFTTGPGRATVTWQTELGGNPAPTRYRITPGHGQGYKEVGTNVRTVSFDNLDPNAIISFAVTAINDGGESDERTSNAITPTVASPLRALTSDLQYRLSQSDGATWQPVDATNLAGSYVAPNDGQLLLSASAALFTATAGVNQDLGIRVGSDDGTYKNEVVAWKESGGSAGTFSPNAAEIEHLLPVKRGVTYRLSLVWKANRNVADSVIYAGAGPLTLANSTTNLGFRFFAAGDPATATGKTVRGQWSLGANDGTTWKPVDAALDVTLAPAADGVATVLANGDLWTSVAGFNQDLGIEVKPSNGPATVVSWKESGGFAGTYSPNAAYAQGRLPVTAGVTYRVRLVWKANRATTGAAVMLGAGNPGSFSPTSLLVTVEPADRVAGVVRTTQATTSTAVQPDTALADTVSFFAPTDGYVVLRANADLWTETTGSNQRLAISTGTYSYAGFPGWTESGGFGGAFSPNAAGLQVVVPVRSGSQNTFQLNWFGNAAGAGPIHAGAGPIDGAFSPTSLYASFVPAG